MKDSKEISDWLTMAAGMIMPSLSYWRDDTETPTYESVLRAKDNQAAAVESARLGHRFNRLTVQMEAIEREIAELRRMPFDAENLATKCLEMATLSMQSKEAYSAAQSARATFFLGMHRSLSSLADVKK